MRIFVCWLGICLVILITAGCAADQAPREGTEPSINVVTTIFPLAEIIEQLGGDQVNVSYLLPAGASPHTYEPTMEQARLIAEAQLFVSVGAGLDEWAFKLTEAAGADLVVLELEETLNLLESGPYYHLEETHEHGDEHHDEPGHHHGLNDPHYWLDPVLVRDEICPRLCEALSALLPEQTAYFEERLITYRQELTVLHEEIAAAAAGFASRDFIAFHSAWQYFGKRYNLREVAVIAQFPGQEPSAGWVAELIGLVKENKIGAILIEPQFSPALAERIAEESGIKVLSIDPLGGENVPGRESYLELMRYNLSVFNEALE